MANPNPSPATRFPAIKAEKSVNLLREARAAEQVTMSRIKDPKTNALELAGLVRAFVALLDCIQRLRGIPTPGQYRPELSPQKLIAALKKANARTPIELMASGTFHDEPGDDEAITNKELDSLGPEPPTMPPTSKDQKTGKESLLKTEGGDRQTGGGGAKEDGGLL